MNRRSTDSGRGGKRAGPGRRALGKTRKTVKLSPVKVRRLETYARRHKLPHFSTAIEAATNTISLSNVKKRVARRLRL